MNSALHLYDPSFSLPRMSASAVRSQTLVGALLAATVLLTGCGGSVLDFRNAEISNGKLYKAGADAGFTGMVTNIPQAKLLSSQPGLAQVNRTLRAALADNFELDRQLLAQSLCDVKVKKGSPDGEAVCKLPRSKTLHSRLNFKDGVLNGAYTRYDLTAANHVLITANFAQGVPDGKQELFSARTQKIINRLPWQDGKMEGEEKAFDPDNGNQTGSYHYKDGKLDGPAMRWGPDGKLVTYRATLTKGAQNGVEEEFYPDTGKPFQRTEWSHGKKNGRFQEWDVQGNLTRDVTYRNDLEQLPRPAVSNPVPGSEFLGAAYVPPANPQACAQAKEAYQLQNDTRQGASEEDSHKVTEACKPAVQRPS
ncbi:MAG: toxin-antitoxin system YwqK family antitoxin [Proteobacteria bacterium]|nr:MAG: toxin-antitoxin system YwqK family antitoxin [Pseudomonadota bacterium]